MKRCQSAIPYGSTLGNMDLLENYAGQQNSAEIEAPDLKRTTGIRKHERRKLKTSGKMTAHFTQDKQRLHFEAITIKEKFHLTTSQNIRLKTRIAVLEKELSRKSQIIMKRSGNELVARKGAQIQSTLTTNLKTLLTQERARFRQLHQKFQQLTNSMKYTQVQQLEIQLKAFQEETVRLKGLLGDFNTEKAQEKKVSRKESKFQLRFKEKEEQNLKLVELNLQYQDRLKGLVRAKEQRDSETKQRQAKLLGDLNNTRKRLAASLKKREILESNLQSLGDSQSRPKTFKSTAPEQQSRFVGNPSPANRQSKHNPNKRPLSASYKMNQPQLHRQQARNMINYHTKQSSDYENIYQHSAQFEEDAETVHKSGDPNHTVAPNNPTEQQQGERSFAQFDQVCYLVTYRLLAQKYEFKTLECRIKQQFVESMSRQDILQVLENHPFYLQLQQCQTLLGYILPESEHPQPKNQSVTGEEFLHVMRQVVQQCESLSEDEIDDVRIKLIRELNDSGDDLYRLFQQSEGYLHLDQMNEALERMGFKGTQIQQLLAEMSLFVYDLSGFSREALDKYISTITDQEEQYEDTFQQEGEQTGQ